MSIAESMKSITEGIIASHGMRAEALGDLAADTRRIQADARKTVRQFASDREKASAEQAANLAKFVGDLSKKVKNMLKAVQNDLRQISADRGRMSKELKKKLADEAKQIETYVKNKLKEYQDAHAEMSDALRKDLGKFVRDIASSVKGLLGDADKMVQMYHSDMGKARAAWRGMTATLSKGGAGEVMPRIQAGKRVTTVKEAVAKKGGAQRRKGSKAKTK